MAKMVVRGRNIARRLSEMGMEPYEVIKKVLNVNRRIDHVENPSTKCKSTKFHLASLILLHLLHIITYITLSLVG